MPTPTSRLALALAAALVGALGGCREPDPYYRHGELPDAAGGDAAGTDALAGADAGGGYECPTCAVSVLYTCRSDDPENPNASFVLDVTNQSNATIALADLTLRYWYTTDHKPQALDCDTAQLGCTNLVTSADPPTAPQPKFVDVLPPRPKANEYVEIAFTLGALSLDPGLDTGEIQLRVHDKDLSLIDQTDDYSFDCAPMGVAFPSPFVTAYVGGVLAWGEEPPSN